MILERFPEHLIPELNKDLPFGYNKGVKEQVDKIILNGVNDQAPERKLVEGITIDASHSLDLDDGIWAEKRKDGGYTIFISIADPTEFIEPLSAIDLDAMTKGTSIYLDTQTIFMLPRELATDIVSLNHNTTRLSQTVQIDYNENLEVISTNFFESKFHNKMRFDYTSFKEHYFNTDREFHSQLRLQDEIAQKLRKKRKEKGTMDFYDAERGIGRSEINSKNIAQELIEEFMVAANIETAKFQLKNYPEKGVYRNHMPQFKGLDLKNINNKDVERAFYSNKMRYHLGLKEVEYTHFTSPMRRYLDFILHRQIKSFLRGDEFNYSKEDLRLIINSYLNQQLNRVYFLEKTYYFSQRIEKRMNNVKKEVEENNLKAEEKISGLKIHIKRGVNLGLKVPISVREEIIETINNSNQRGDRLWMVGVYLLSGEKEIIEALKNKIYKEQNFRKTLNSILETRIIKRKDKDIFKQQINNGEIDIYINGSKVVKNAKDSREAVDKLFEYALNKKDDL